MYEKYLQFAIGFEAVKGPAYAQGEGDYTRVWGTDVHIRIFQTTFTPGLQNHQTEFSIEELHFRQYFKWY